VLPLRGSKAKLIMRIHPKGFFQQETVLSLKWRWSLNIRAITQSSTSTQAKGESTWIGNKCKIATNISFQIVRTPRAQGTLEKSKFLLLINICNRGEKKKINSLKRAKRRASGRATNRLLRMKLCPNHYPQNIFTSWKAWHDRNSSDDHLLTWHHGGSWN